MLDVCQSKVSLQAFFSQYSLQVVQTASCDIGSFHSSNRWILPPLISENHSSFSSVLEACLMVQEQV